MLYANKRRKTEEIYSILIFYAYEAGQAEVEAVIVQFTKLFEKMENRNFSFHNKELNINFGTEDEDEDLEFVRCQERFSLLKGERAWIDYEIFLKTSWTFKSPTSIIFCKIIWRKLKETLVS